MATCSIPENQQKFTLITANIGYAGHDHDTDKRKEAIAGLLNDISPTIVILQESMFKKFGQQFVYWKDVTFPKDYNAKIKGEDAKFLYKKDQVKLKTVDIGKILKANDRSTDGLPLDLISMVEAEPKDKSIPKFLCVSWHGQHKKGVDTQRRDLKSLIELVTMFSEKLSLPVIIGGDFNVPFSGIESVLEETGSSYIGYNYKPSERRSFKKTVDFFVSSSALTLKGIAPVDWGRDDVKQLLDHDPIIAELQCNPDKDEQDGTKEEQKRTHSGMEDSFKKMTI